MYTMLVVDDNPNDRRGVTGLIDWREQQIEVVGTAVNGEDGYRKAAELKPDFVLTDVSMPLMNGIEMTEKIKRELPDTRFVFMSCFDDLAYLQAAIDLEVNAYVLKPIELEELVQVFAKLRGLKEGDIRKRRLEASLHKLVEESLPLLREQFMKELFQREEIAMEEVEERLAYLKLEGGLGSYAVLYMQIDNYELHYRSLPVHKRHLLLYSLQSCVQQTLAGALAGWSIASHYDTLLALVPCPPGEEESFLNGVTERANRCIEAANEQLELQLTIGIGEISSDWTSVSMAYRQAEAAARSKFYSKGNQVIFYTEIGRHGSGLETDKSQLASEVRSLLAQRQDSRIEALLDKYYSGDAACSEKEIKLLSYTIVHVVQSSLLEAGKSIEDVSGDEPRLWKDLSLLETISEVRGLIRQLLHNACQALVQDEAIGKNKRIVEDLKAIIDERYASIESVHQIVEHLQISASHANLIFKRESGHTMFDYLTQRRVEAAKGMLRDDPYLKVYEVAERVGYRTEAHFRSVFKAHTGLTPGKFQEMASQ
ncbi:response regulator [Paenibacillus sp. MY03]|jgi:two-component system response regulator YesN|uniref:response regulator n=1 Tax=Paenibacillus sp. MY03 TaxID=302980 RepID=UPI0015C61941|nr:response regulator [Paenibacillus sp. MY03]